MVNLELKINDNLKKYLFKKIDRYHEATLFMEAKPGVQYMFHFENGYGASVVKRYASYGYEKDLWELALLLNVYDDEYKLHYDEVVNDGVLGYLSDKQVNRVLEAIKDGKVKEYIEDLYSEE